MPLFSLGAAVTATLDPTTAEQLREEMMRQIDRRQKRLARDCSVTVMCGIDAALHHGDLDRRVARTFPGATRYDLLAEPLLSETVRDPRQLAQLSADLSTTIALHSVERLMIVTADQDTASALLTQLTMHSPFKVEGITASAAAGLDRAETVPEHLVASCIDWRLHGTVGGMFAALAASGIKGYTDAGLMTVAGVGKELRPGDIRFDAVTRRLCSLRERGLKGLLLLGHTDCGKYGGSTVFGNHALKEARALGDDLAVAAKAISNAVPGLEIDIALCSTGERSIASISPFSHLLR
jgi:hypothetical protein